MSNVTLVLTRTPLEPFHDGNKGGRFGKLWVITGPLVKKASFEEIDENGLASVTSLSLDVRDEEKTLWLGLEGAGDVDGLLIFDSMERYQDRGSIGYYMQVQPQARRGIDYYPLTMMISSTVRDIYAKNGIQHNGSCLRVDNHGYNAEGTSRTAGILVHTAHRVGFLTGCIGPGQKFGNRMADGSSDQAMAEIFAAMGGFSHGKTARLIVLDW